MPGLRNANVQDWCCLSLDLVLEAKPPVFDRGVLGLRLSAESQKKSQGSYRQAIEAKKVKLL